MEMLVFLAGVLAICGLAWLYVKFQVYRSTKRLQQYYRNQREEFDRQLEIFFQEFPDVSDEEFFKLAKKADSDREYYEEYWRYEELKGGLRLRRNWWVWIHYLDMLELRNAYRSGRKDYKFPKARADSEEWIRMPRPTWWEKWLGFGFGSESP